MSQPSSVGAVALPGRLGDPEASLATDPRCDPRMVAALEPFGLHVRGPEPPVTRNTPREELLAYCAEAEAGFEAVFAALFAGLAPVEGVTSDTLAVQGVDQNRIPLYLHRPAGADGPLPCVFHIHGGGMVLLEAAGPSYVRWRDELAARGVLVAGVEFRNGAGKLGAHPFPAGLDDCVSALRWVIDNADEIGASKVVVSGESGGANLTLAVTHRAKREGWLGDIAGVYAQCPYISNLYATKPPELVSLHENDEYFLGCALMDALAAVYDPGGAHATDPLCWPHHATVEELSGMPPHVVSVNELDPLRDEGLAYYRKLVQAGVPTVGRLVSGTCHAGDLLFPRAMPEVYAASARDVVGFVTAL
jgi:acetyl esterase/lipase